MDKKLYVSESGRYLMRGDKPFFWLADTAWLLFYKLSEEEVRLYLRNRKEKGYNVILAVMVHEQGSFKEFRSDGSLDLDDTDHWDFIEKVLSIAGEMDLYMGLLPAWGSVVAQGILNRDNIEAYAGFLGKRFRHFDNIIWLTGGDIRGTDLMDLYNGEAKTLKKYNPERLMTYHPFGRTCSSQWFHNEAWLDFNTFQSGHRRYDQQQLGEWDDAVAKEEFFGEDNWRYVRRALNRNPLKPVLDSEPSYEGIPQGLHNPRNGYWEEWDVRRYAYWSVFEGAAGHTYGSNGVMQFHKDMAEAGSFGPRELWQEAIHHPGSAQMQFLKELMLSVDFASGHPREDLLLYGQKERYHRIAVFAGEDFIFCYDYSGDQFLLNLEEYEGKTMDAYWMNPADGTCSYAGPIQGESKYLASPAKRKGAANDWVFILKTSKEKRGRKN